MVYPSKKPTVELRVARAACVRDDANHRRHGADYLTTE
jgi:hypothetical protein